MKKTLLFGTSLALALATADLSARSASVMTTEAFEFNTRVADDVVIADTVLKVEPLKGEAGETTATAFRETPLMKKILSDEASKKAFAKAWNVTDEALDAKLAEGKVDVHSIAVALARDETLRKIVEEFRAGAEETVKAEKEAKAKKQEGETPKTEGEAPKTEGEAPKTEGEAPKTEGETPKTEGEAPKTEGVKLAPPVEGVAAQAADAATAAGNLEGLEGYSEVVVEAPVATELTEEQRAAQTADAEAAARELEGL